MCIRDRYYYCQNCITVSPEVERLVNPLTKEQQEIKRLRRDMKRCKNLISVRVITLSKKISSDFSKSENFSSILLKSSQFWEFKSYGNPGQCNFSLCNLDFEEARTWTTGCFGWVDGYKPSSKNLLLFLVDTFVTSLLSVSMILKVCWIRQALIELSTTI